MEWAIGARAWDCVMTPERLRFGRCPSYSCNQSETISLAARFESQWIHAVSVSHTLLSNRAAPLAASA